MGSPVLWGPNNYANNLQNAELTATGALLAFNGAKNYITYGNFENQVTTGWSLGTIGTLTNGLPTGSPTFGSGAAGTLSTAITTSANIAQTASIQLISSAATTQGNMLATQAYSIDTADQAKVLTIQFYYAATSGAANSNFSGTSSNSWAWAVWDVTNSSWLTSAGNFNLVQNSGVGYCTGTVQTNATTAQIRLVIYAANATSGAATLTLDSFYVGPQTAPMGPVMDDWVAYTPTITGFGTPTNVSFFSRRIGKDLEIQGVFTSGSTTAVSNLITLGYKGANNNVVWDTSSFPAGGTNNVVGSAAASVLNAYSLSIVTTTGGIAFGVQSSSYAGSAVAVGNTIAASGTSLSFFARVPIVGWSSNAISSADTDTRICAAVYTGATTTLGASATTVVFPTVSIDTHGAMNSTNGIYTIPISGIYQITGYLITSSTTGTGTAIMYAVQAGSATVSREIGRCDKISATSAPKWLTGSTKLQCNANDTIKIQALDPDLNALQSVSYFEINRLSGPAVITATESVNARYYLSSGKVIAANNAGTIVNYDTKDFDSHNAVTTGASWVFTTPVSGTYSIEAMTTLLSLPATYYWELRLYKNASLIVVLDSTVSGSGTLNLTARGYTLLKLNAGDTLNIYGFQSYTATLTTTGDGHYGYVNIARVGN